MAATGGFLSGLRVLDLSIWRPGPYATSLLVPLGADVLKVEPPGGDPMRFYPGLFAAVNEGKRSVELDLKDADGRARALELAAQADVLVEGFRPGVLARFGLGRGGRAGAQSRHRLLLHLRLRPARPSRRAARARRQLPGVVGRVDARGWHGDKVPPLPTADLAAGLTAAFGICAAVLGRRTSGEGAYLDVSMTDVLATWTGPAGPRTAEGSPGDCRARRRPATASSRRPTAGRWRSVCSTNSTSGRACAGNSGSADGGGPRLRRAPSAWRRAATPRRRGRRDPAPRRTRGTARRRRRPGRSRAGPGGDAGGTSVPPVPDPAAAGRAARPVPALDQHHGEGFVKTA